jgi:protocadherin Fat 4
VTVEAVDKDVRPPNNEFTYSILGGEGSKAFRIDSRSGVIETVSLLDRERQAVYNVTVGAIDRGVPPQTGTTEVHIVIQDINDNSPIFEPMHPIGSVFENEPPGTSVMILSAIDADQAPNAEPFTYTIAGGEHKDYFVVDKDTGVLRTTNILDREEAPQMTILVEIADGGTPRLKSQLPVIINVLDKNDNPSMVRTVRLIVNIFTETFLGGRIADVRPNDLDIAGQYQCRIVSGQSGSAANLFSIPRGCNLHASRIHKPSDYNLKISLKTI